MRDENTSARLSAKNAGGAYREGGVFAGHYGTRCVDIFSAKV